MRVLCQRVYPDKNVHTYTHTHRQTDRQTRTFDGLRVEIILSPCINSFVVTGKYTRKKYLAKNVFSSSVSRHEPMLQSVLLPCQFMIGTISRYSSICSVMLRFKISSNSWLAQSVLGPCYMYEVWPIN